LLISDKVFLDYTRSHLITVSTSPLTVDAYIVGNLPDPCHLLRITESTLTASKMIKIEVYSLVKPGTICITVLKPFAVTYPLGTFTAGVYTVTLNGVELGKFGSSSTGTITAVK
jgi:hypothetical protein